MENSWDAITDPRVQELVDSFDWSLPFTLPSAKRENLTCPIFGTVAWDTLPLEDAEAAVSAAALDRDQRRNRPDPAPSPIEHLLLAAFWFYGERPELQHPIGPYDADFYFPEYHTAVEVDGRDYHSPDSDAKRDAYFARHGVYTIRIPAALVYADALACARNAARGMVHRKRHAS